MSLDFFAKKISLSADEELVSVIHHHPLTFLKQIMITLVLLLGNFFFMFYLFSLGSIGVALFLAIFFTAVFYGGREFYIWYSTVFIITSQRIIDYDQTGFFSRTVSEATYDKIIDISYKVKGVSQTLLKLGTIKIKASGVNLILSNIKHVTQVNQLITDLIKEQTGRKIEVKKIKTITSETKKQIANDFLKQDELDDYDEYDLDKLVDAYVETLGELRLKKTLVDQLTAVGYGEEKESASKTGEEAPDEPEIEEIKQPSPEPKAPAKFKKRRLE